MHKTYKLMSACTNEEYLNRELNDLVAEYKATDDARLRNKLIATIFCKLYPMILKLQKTYNTLTHEQKIEHILYHLVKSLNRFDVKKAKFITFFYGHIQNQLKTLLASENNYKRAAMQNIVHNNDEVLRVYSQTTPDNSYEKQAVKLLKEINDASYLSTEEKEYCGCIISGKRSFKDIAEALHLTERNMVVAKRLVTNPLFVKDNSLSLAEEMRLRNERLAIRKVKTIKESIKKKAKELAKHGIDIFKD